jgi:hypothetical protein
MEQKKDHSSSPPHTTNNHTKITDEMSQKSAQTKEYIEGYYKRLENYIVSVAFPSFQQ